MSGEWYNYGKQVPTSTWDNASRDESLIYILYLFKKKNNQQFVPHIGALWWEI